MGIDLLVEEEANSGGISLGLAGDYAIYTAHTKQLGWLALRFAKEKTD